jgi:hypothetical protein
MKKAGVAIVVSAAVAAKLEELATMDDTGMTVSSYLTNAESALVKTSSNEYGDVTIHINEEACIASLKLSLKIASVLGPLFAMAKAIEKILEGDFISFKKELKEIEDNAKAE